MEYLQYLMLQEHSVETIRTYTKSVEAFHKATGKPDTDITSKDISEYLASLLGANSAATRGKKLAALKHYFGYLVKEGSIPYNPALSIESPKIGKRLPVYLSLEESLSLLKSVEGKNKERDICIITLFLNCGLRLSELVSINLSSIRKDTLTVIGKGNKERTIYLNKACLKSIKNYLAVRSVEAKDPKALFISERYNRISPKTVQVVVKKAIRAAGLSHKYSTHKLRHTAATLLYKYGKVDIRALKEILGHESIATTEIYTHVDEEQLREAIKSNPLNLKGEKKNDRSQGTKHNQKEKAAKNRKRTR